MSTLTRIAINSLIEHIKLCSHLTEIRLLAVAGPLSDIIQQLTLRLNEIEFDKESLDMLDQRLTIIEDELNRVPYAYRTDLVLVLDRSVADCLRVLEKVRAKNFRFQKAAA